MTDKQTTYLTIGLAVALLVAVGVAGAALRSKARAERDLAVSKANTEAAMTEQVQVIEEGRAAVLRLQLQHDADSLARITLGAALEAMNQKLGVTVKALTGLQIDFKARMQEFGEGIVEMVAATPHGDTVRIAAFQEEGPPVEGEIVVEVPVDPQESIMLTSVLKPTPWQATLQLGCTENHVASFALDVPEWVPAEIALGAVDQEICNPLPNLSFTGELFRIDASKMIWAGGGSLLTLLALGLR